jgi:hypothetical protein
MAIKLNTGKIAFEINFDGNDKDYIYFNPNDPDLAIRLMASKDRINERIEKMNFDDVAVNEKGEIANVDITNLSIEDAEKVESQAKRNAQILEESKKIICEELNTAFDSDVSSVVFKHCSPFAVVNGERFIVQFLTAMIPEVKRIITKSNAEAEKKMAKHLDKYRK